MSLIRSKNTKPELVAFKYLRQQKIYFQKHYYKSPVSIDIALPRKKRAVFIDGDFWHGRTLEKRKDNLPMFWITKIIRNVKRDKSYRSILKMKGWEVLRIWESDIMTKRTRQQTLENLAIFLKSK